ncbi:hypothetical protein HPB51_029119 [Rhipicephalus microplus]|uniref:Uncharacterized protein n=1 Tax=Rhipicephalus microplus TaxID=6941 RepID=A0A9J6CVT5_RHIMP|nr:hypothetical protein HPB51_029119 [Rhipicephalus microplus]
MAELHDDASMGSKPTSDSTELSRTESICSQSSLRASSEFHVTQDDVLQELGLLHQKMEQTALQCEGPFRTPVTDLESGSAKNAASSGEATPVDPKRVVTFQELPKDPEIPISMTTAIPVKDIEIPNSKSTAAPTQEVKPSSRSSWLSVKLSHLSMSRQKGDKSAKRKTKKKMQEARDATSSSSNRRLRSALGPSLGSFAFVAFVLVAIILVFAYAIAFRGSRDTRRSQELALRKATNGTLLHE